jgi:hypothetical protein
MGAYTMPALDFDQESGEKVPSILLDGEPELDEGRP